MWRFNTFKGIFNISKKFSISLQLNLITSTIPFKFIINKKYNSILYLMFINYHKHFFFANSPRIQTNILHIKLNSIKYQ